MGILFGQKCMLCHHCLFVENNCVAAGSSCIFRARFRLRTFLFWEVTILICKHCGKEMNEKIGICAHCGKKAEKSKKWLFLLIPLGVLFTICIVIITTTNFNNEMSKAENYIIAQDYDKAKDILEYQLNTNDTQPKVYLVFADYYISQKEYLNAVEILEDGLSKCPNNKNIEEKLNKVKTNFADEIAKMELEKQKQEEAEKKEKEEANKHLVSSAEMIQLKIWTEDNIKKILKAPSTAEFPGSFLSPFEDWNFSKNGNKYTVSAYVDSQNSFSAMIRSDFTITYEWKGDTAKVISLIFDGEKIV